MSVCKQKKPRLRHLIVQFPRGAGSIVWEDSKGCDVRLMTGLTCHYRPDPEIPRRALEGKDKMYGLISLDRHVVNIFRNM
jgi:hypothetical protein